MNPACALPKKKVGRPPKPKDEVLGAFVSACLVGPFHAELLAAARMAGYSRPQFLRILLQRGLAAWRQENSAGFPRAPRHNVIAAPQPWPAKEEHDATS